MACCGESPPYAADGLALRHGRAVGWYARPERATARAMRQVMWSRSVWAGVARGRSAMRRAACVRSVTTAAAARFSQQQSAVWDIQCGRRERSALNISSPTRAVSRPSRSRGRRAAADAGAVPSPPVSEWRRWRSPSWPVWRFSARWRHRHVAATDSPLAPALSSTSCRWSIVTLPFATGNGARARGRDAGSVEPCS